MYHDINGTTKQKKKQKGQKIVGIKRYQKPTLRECKILSFNCLRKLRSEKQETLNQQCIPNTIRLIN